MKDSLEKKLEKLITVLSSLKVATMLIVLVCIASIAGTLLQQETANELIYNSFWFQLLLLFLMLITIYCQLIKVPQDATKWPVYLIHLSIPIILVGAFIGYIWGDRAYMQVVERGFSNTAIRDNNTIWNLPFKVYLEDFILETYKEKITHTLIIKDKNNKQIYSSNFDNKTTLKPAQLNTRIDVLKIIPNVELDPEGNILSMSSHWKNPAIKLKINDKILWLFANTEEFQFQEVDNLKYTYSCEIKNIGIKDFKSKVAIIKDGKKLLEKTIEVNHPLNYDGYMFYQAEYDAKNLRWTGLLVKKDPGVPIVYLGFIVIIVGLFMKLYHYTRQ